MNLNIKKEHVWNFMINLGLFLNGLLLLFMLMLLIFSKSTTLTILVTFVVSLLLIQFIIYKMKWAVSRKIKWGVNLFLIILLWFGIPSHLYAVTNIILLVLLLYLESSETKENKTL
jgi:hypothetical protein